MSGLPEDDYRAINTEATLGLARAAARAGFAGSCSSRPFARNLGLSRARC
jgi:hypothetical protein